MIDKKKNLKKEFKKRIYLIIILITSLILFNFIIDPFQQYRLPKLYKIGNLRAEERYLNAGLIRNAKYDTILIGSSMTRNFSENYIKKVLNWDIVKLTMSGGNQEEIKFVMDHIDCSKVKNIIIGIDLWAFENINTKADIPNYLYKEKLELKDNWNYLTNIGVLKQSIKLIYYNLIYYNKIEEKFKLGYEYKYSQEEVLRKEVVKSSILNYDLNLNNYSNEMIENYNVNLKIILEKYKDKQIILFFPPYSIIAYKNMVEEETIQKYLAFKKFLVEETSKYSNIKLYDFQDIKEITHNLNNYGDKSHYSPEVSQKLVDFIKEDKYRVTSENVVERIRNLEFQLKNDFI